MRILSLVIAAVFALSANAQAMETAAKQAILVDYQSGAVLLEKAADAQMHPSSMSKLMTLYVLFQRLKGGRVKLDDSFTVSEKAWRMEGSKSFVHVGDAIKVEDLIQGIIVQSGNDACIVVAEGVSGSEEAFAAELTRVGKEIGLTHSHFVNSTGWTDEAHLTTSRDLSHLARRLIDDFPEYYHYFAEREFTFGGIKQPNRNRLLGGDLGVDGLKTGHTELAGYGITLSAKNAQGRRLILVVNGLTSENERADEGDRLLRYGFREFTNQRLAGAGESVGSIPVWMGAKAQITLAAKNDLYITLPQANKEAAKLTLVADRIPTAPIEQGAAVANLKVQVAGAPDQMIPLYAAEPVAKLGPFGRLVAATKYYLGM